MLVCPSSQPLDLTDTCVRHFWSAALPAVVVVLLLLSSIPLPAILKRGLRFVTSPWQNFLTLSEAEAYEFDEKATQYKAQNERVPMFVTLFLSVVAMLQVIAWTTIATYTFAVLGNGGEETIWDALRAVVITATWLYAAVKPIVNPRATPPYDLLILYVLHLIGGIVTVGGVLYDHQVWGDPLPSTVTALAHAFNIIAIVCLVVAVLARPVGIPSKNIDPGEIGKSISPEDYTSLWGWVSFSWVVPLISRGTSVTLNEKDVWELSSTMRAKPVFLKFSELKRKTLLRQIWAANSMDISLDFVLTFTSVTFNYAGPFFLKRIIDAIGDPSPERRAQGYIFACLALCSTILKATSDVLHLWYGRRAAVRIRSELMSGIYDKALKRKDFSGVINKDGQEKKKSSGDAKKDAKEEKKAKEKADDPKAGADVGKIVNLMANDANRIAMLVSGMYFIYGAPFEIIIACTFLYQLLGWSAFAGFAVLLLGWPLNNFIARRSVRISKGVLAARDKRMSVLNEIIGAIKFIKFFAWEDRWIQRALDSRKFELKWLIKSRINSIMFQVLWSTAPILVSILSFLTFVSQGNELTLGVAFTAIALFGMLRAPLNVIPTWIVQILQTRVAMQRIEIYLNEEEVDEQVSSLKRTNVNVACTPPPSEFGIRQASFRWNAVEEKTEEKTKDDTKKRKGSEPRASDSSDETVVAEESTPDTNRVFELSDISVTFPDGELTLVTGPTASGKSALLLALLGEMTMLPGGEILMSKEPERVDEHDLMHSISYSAQTPWLQHQSIKDNILFGYPYEEVRYNEVVECCALGPDLEILEDGDETEIGARGVSLSGGQKARVALARAVYARSKFVLLDDPLSAVDSHTSRFLYERLFLGPLMQHRTVVLVTHHVELVLPGAYYLVRMLDGRIDMHGSVKDLRNQGLLEALLIESETEKGSEVHEKQETNPATSDKEQEDVVQGSIDEPVKVKKPRKLIKDEERETGGVKWSIYKTYLKASSYWTWGILFTIVLIAQLLGFTERFWIMVWGEAYGNGSGDTLWSSAILPSVLLEQQIHFEGAAVPSQHFTNHPQAVTTYGLRDRLPSARDRPLFYVAVYAIIGFTTVLVSVCSAIVQYTGALRASRNLFKRLLTSVVRATMRWQDVTPAGRMLNRFSKDIETVDTSLASSLQAVNSSLANFFSSMIIVVAVFPLFVVPATIFGFIYYSLAIGYLNTGRDLRRMESTSRSPIFSGFGELLEGVVTVRAFSAERRFMNNLYKKIDLTLRMWYSFWMTNRWLLLRFDCLGAVAVFTTTIFGLSGVVDAGWAALSITSTMAFTSSIYWACRFWTQLELDLNSVERVVEYLDLPQEPPAIIDDCRPPAHWPSSTGPNENSLLVVENLTVRYAPELPAVLHGISFTLKARERVGLLGRTGSGKSTLAMSVLRFVDPTEGRIMIDGIDITKIGVHDLRSRLTFIPQDATLFSGTLRDNLDPFNDYSDDECLDALYRVQMLSKGAYQSQRSSRTTSRAPSIHGSEASDSEPSSSRAPSELSSSPTATATELLGNGRSSPKITLDSDVSAGGLNFSAGQRQLIAMARALLRQSSFIVLDEATSSIDFETDSKIQTAIREEFGNSLLLTVAHRLRTVIDYDRLIVLDQGKVAETDTPWNLINKEGGIFRGMCLKSGTYAELEKAAKAKALGDQ